MRRPRRVHLLAGMWAFVKNDIFSAVALSSYGGFWTSFWALNQFSCRGSPSPIEAAR